MTFWKIVRFGKQGSMSLEVLIFGREVRPTVEFSYQIRLREFHGTRQYAKKSWSATHLVEFVEDELLASGSHSNQSQ